jgi:zinc D-Ala-D-Ala dipeptidase
MYKITQGIGIVAIWGLFFLCTPLVAVAQDTLANPFGLYILRTMKALEQTVEANPNKAMLSLKRMIPTIVIDLRYAGTDNFTRRALYPRLFTSFLRQPAVAGLQKVQAALRKRGLGLKIYDAYRPYSATRQMWDLVKDERYAANPKNGSGHNRGTAVDLTLVDLRTRKELPMGTAFDNFSDTAHHAFAALPPVVLQNRLLLKTLMEANGFKALDTEWWHYSLQDAKNFELLDIPFEGLLEKSRQTGYR